MDDLIKGLEWLATEGRGAAEQLQNAVDNNPQLSANLDEAVSWLVDISEGNEL